MTTLDSLRTEAEAAALLGISAHSLKRMRLSGNGPPSMRIGRASRYHPRLLEEWIIDQFNKKRNGAPGIDEKNGRWRYRFRSPGIRACRSRLVSQLQEET